MLHRTRASALFAVIAAAIPSTTAFAGHVGGPKAAYGEEIAPNTFIAYDVYFHAGELAEVVVDGQGSSDLDLYIYDENGDLVASDTEVSDFCHASVVPQWTGQFRIEVHNIGIKYNWFDIETN